MAKNAIAEKIITYNYTDDERKIIVLELGVK